MGERYERTLPVVTRTSWEVDPDEGNRFAPASFVGVGLLALALLALLAQAASHAAVIASILSVCGLLAMRLGFDRRPRRLRSSTEAARVSVSRAGIVVDGRHVPAADIAHAYFQPRSGASPTVLCVDARWGALFEAEVADEGEAEAFLRALGRDATARDVLRPDGR